MMTVRKDKQSNAIAIIIETNNKDRRPLRQKGQIVREGQEEWLGSKATANRQE
jgi:hypothetical protein